MTSYEKFHYRFEDLKENGYKVKSLDRSFDRFANEYGDAPEEKEPNLGNMLRQTMSYGLIVFVVGLLIVAAYVLMKTL